MSFCRWSSDYCRCDLYVYESDRGFESLVAGRRINVAPPADLLAMPRVTAEDWVAWLRAEDAWYDGLKVDGEIPDELWLDLATIGPEAGGRWLDATAGECAQRLRSLKAKGFNVPDSAIESLEAEASETMDHQSIDGGQR